MIKAVNPKDYLAPRFWPMWFALALMRLMSKLPLRLLEFFGTSFGGLIYYALPSRRRITQINLRIAFPNADESTISRMTKLCFQNIGIAAFETGLSWWENKRLLKLCEIQGLEHLMQAQQQGKGVIILTAHFTCLEIGGPVLNQHVPFQVMYKRAHNPLFNAFMRYHRERLYKAVVDHHKPITLIRGLKKGYAAWYAPDQNFAKKDAVFVPFFGVDASTLTAPARFAKISKSPVVPYYIKRKGKGLGYTLVILPALKNFPKNDPIADATVINQTIESLVLKNPEQYLWAHKRYKTRPDGQADIY